MIVDVDICNKALKYVGADSISSLDDNTANARECKASYDPARDSVLTDFPWEFATFIVQPTLIASETLVGWSYLYALPAKCLAVRKLFIDDSSTNPDPIEHRECISPSTLRRAVAVNFEDPYLEYTHQITDPKLWSTKFADTLALRIAAEIGVRVTGRKEEAAEAANRYSNMVSEAKRLDAASANIKKTKTSSYENAR